MVRTLAFVTLVLLVVVSFSYAQNTDLFIPAGYNNPFLKSGQFITSLYYADRSTVYKLEEQESKNSEYNFSFVGYLGLSDKFTLQAGLDIFPSQTSNEIIAGGSGADNNKFHISPQILLSYRPVTAVEIFGNVFYQNYITEHGDRTRYQEVPVGVDEDGNLIYERRLITQPGYGNSDLTAINYKIGISYNGRLW